MSSSVIDVPLTSERYPGLKRGNYAKLESEDVAAFKEILDENRVLSNEEELDGETVKTRFVMSVSYLTEICLLIVEVNLTFPDTNIMEIH